MWSPNIDEIDGPRYLAVASAIAKAIDGGELQPGAQLPPQRDLADQLGLTVGTITRAYALAKKQRLVSGEVGRGTFVRSNRETTPRMEFRPSDNQHRLIDLSCYRTPGRGPSDLVSAAFADLSERSGLLPLHKYPPAAGLLTHRGTAADWLARTIGLEARPEDVLVCAGAQQGIAVALSTLAVPGDTILTEAITFPGFKAIASLQSLKLYGVDLDEHGMKPDALRAAVDATDARIVFLQPTLHNPTTAIMPLERRQEIAKLAHERDLMIIEDDASGAALLDRPKPIAALAPEHTLYIASLAKCLSPALRIGYLVAPPAMTEAFASTLHAMTLGASPLIGELASMLLVNGAAEEAVRRMNRETARTHALAEQILGRNQLRSHPASVHMWLLLPPEWRATDFETMARRAGVAVAASDSFLADERQTAPAVRVSLNASADEEVLRRGLTILQQVLTSRPHPIQMII